MTTCRARLGFCPLRTVLLAMLGASPLSTVRAQSPEYQGLTGGLLAGEAVWRLDDGRRPAHFAGGLFAGYRFRIADVDGAIVSVTPRFAITLTNFAGIRLHSSEVAFSRIDLPGGQLAIRLGKVRPYLLADHGTVTIERYAGPDLLNYSGRSTSFGLGIELPRDNPCGAGFDIAVRRTSAQLTNYEWRGTGAPPPGGSLGATIVTVGWSGRFRGSQLLFACH